MIDEKVRAEIQAIFDRDGEVTVSAILDKAKNKRSALHAQFEWDDTKAAAEYRNIQARHLARKVRVVAIKAAEPERLIHVPKITPRDKGDSGEGAYKPASVIVRSKTDFQMALEAALMRLQSAQRAVEELRAAVQESDDESLPKILLAYEALATANNALMSVH